LKINGKEVEDKKIYSLALQGYHANNCLSYLNISPESLLENGSSKVVTTSAQQALEEYLKTRQNLESQIEGRLFFVETS
ncbi:MAG: bifunctional metallophosphatase/5'-nucleotidase, partial [Patescibacteria group bacterium]